MKKSSRVLDRKHRVEANANPQKKKHDYLCECSVAQPKNTEGCPLTTKRRTHVDRKFVFLSLSLCFVPRAQRMHCAFTCGWLGHSHAIFTLSEPTESPPPFPQNLLAPVSSVTDETSSLTRDGGGGWMVLGGCQGTFLDARLKQPSVVRLRSITCPLN